MSAHPEPTAWLRCKVSPGMFPHEVGIDGRQVDGSVFSLFAPKEAADHGDQPLQGSVEGWLRVRLVDRKGDHVLVELPSESFQNGYFITVRVDQLVHSPPTFRCPRCGGWAFGRDVDPVRLAPTKRHRCHSNELGQPLSSHGGKPCGWTGEWPPAAPPSQDALLAEMQRHSFVPPPGTPDSVELLREDRRR